MVAELRIFLKGSAVSCIATIVIGTINYFTRRVMALSLDQELYGFFYSAFSLCMLIILFLDIGLNQSSTILLSERLAQGKKSEAKSIFWAHTYCKFLLSLLFAFVFFLLTNWLIKFYFQYNQGRVIFFYFCILLITTSLTGVVFSTLNAFKEFVLSNLFHVGNALVIMLGVYWGINKYPQLSPVISYIVATTMVVLGGFYYFKNSKPFLFSKRISVNISKSFNDFWQLGKWITISTACMTALYYMDTIMLTYFSDLESAAIYNIALPILQIYQGFLIFPLVLTPIASELWINKKKDELKLLIKRITIFGIVILFCSIIIIFAFPINKVVISLLFSENFISAATTLNILCVGMLVLSLGQLYANTLMVLGQSRVVALVSIVTVILNIVANIILIPKYNINGAALATAVSYILMSFSNAWYLRKTIGELL